MATENTFAVIDGATARHPLKFGDQSSGQFAADVVKKVLETSNSTVNGFLLAELMTSQLNKEMSKLGLDKVIIDLPEARPGALFIAARIVGDKIIITSLGDLGCRINGDKVLLEPLKIEEINVGKRIRVMNETKIKNPNIPDKELLEIGKNAVEEDIKEHTRSYYNNPDSDFGHGIIDGRDVPEKYVRVYKFNRKNVKTLELFSDGYFRLGVKPDISAWEQAFEEVEKEDPLKYGKYQAIKGSDDTHFTDDRTILIASMQ